MTRATHPPRRMGFSFQSRCRIVQLVLARSSPPAARPATGSGGASSGAAGALADRRSTPRRKPRRLAPAEAEIAPCARVPATASRAWPVG
jgi:hypothetical protein